MQMIVLTATTNVNGKRQLTGKEIGKILPIAEGKKGTKHYKRGEDSLRHWKNLEPVLRELIKEHGDLPPPKWLQKNKHSGVNYAVCKYHGGFSEVRKRLGLEAKRRDGEESFRNWGKLASRLRIIIEEKGNLPGWGWFIKNGYSSEAHAINCFHGGFPQVRERLGLGQKGKFGKESLRHWKNIEPKLKEIINAQGNLPGQIWFGKNGYGYVIAAIQKYHGGLPAVRKRLELRQFGRFGADSLRHWKNIAPILKKIVAECGELPPGGWFSKNGLMDVSRAIEKHHGGYSAVKKKLGLEQRIRLGDESFSHWEKLKPVLVKLIAEQGGLPSSKWLGKNGFSSAAAAICMYHGGFSEVRKKLGLEQKIKTGKDSLMHWENLEPILRKIVEEQGKLPSQEWFSNNSLSSISVAIGKYHGGMSAVREKLRQLGILKDVESDADIFAKLKGAMGTEAPMK